MLKLGTYEIDKIYNENSYDAIKKILQEQGLDDKQYTPQDVLEKISRFKDKGLTIEKVINDYKSNTTTRIYQEYQKRFYVYSSFCYYVAL